MFKILLLLSLQAFSSELVVWNVGQGQWVTEVQEQFCVHYDLGGEINPAKKVHDLCKNRKNFLHLSHWDWDHISFVHSYLRLQPNACLISKPKGPLSLRKKMLFKTLPVCSATDLNLINSSMRILQDSLALKKSNQSSAVVWSKAFRLLLPGDSPKSQEKYWQWEIPSQTRGLILGHHGSRTSTLPSLFRRMPKLRWAVASARSQRYGHPHRQVVEILKKEKVPLLKTEDWGHLHFIRAEVPTHKR